MDDDPNATHTPCEDCPLPTRKPRKRKPSARPPVAMSGEALLHTKRGRTWIDLDAALVRGLCAVDGDTVIVTFDPCNEGPSRRAEALLVECCRGSWRAYLLAEVDAWDAETVGVRLRR